MRIFTSDVRGAHVMNGIVQLMRLLPNPPEFPPGSLDMKVYKDELLNGLEKTFNSVARGLSVTRAKATGSRVRQTVYLNGRVARPYHQDTLAHLKTYFSGVDGLPLEALEPSQHECLSAALNADGRVYDKGGADPSTPGFCFFGYSSSKTIVGFHALTFLGLLAAQDTGCDCLRSLHAHLLDTSDPQSKLVQALRIGAPNIPSALSPEADLRGCFPLPTDPPGGEKWKNESELAGQLTHNLLDWAANGLPKSEVLMEVVDLASLLNLMRLLRWADAERLILLSPLRRAERASERAVIEVARRSFDAALGRLEQKAEHQKLILEKAKTNDPRKTNKYRPRAAARNMGVYSGWLSHRTTRGGARLCFSPGPRQLTTLVHALLAPGDELSWSEFSDRATKIGLALGGPRDDDITKRVGRHSATALREAGRLNRERLVSFGLARQESDNVVIVDGGERCSRT